MDKDNKKQRFSPTVFFRTQKARILWISSKIDIFFPIFSILGYLIKKVIQVVDWFTKPRGFADEIFFRIGLVFRLIFFVILLWGSFNLWRFCHGIIWEPELAVYVQSPMAYYFRIIDGGGSSTLVDYVYMIERYAEPLGAYNTVSLPKETFWGRIYKLNKSTLDWRPTYVPPSVVFDEVKRMFLYMWNHKYPEYPKIGRYMSLLYGLDKSSGLYPDFFVRPFRSWRIYNIPFMKDIPYIRSTFPYNYSIYDLINKYCLERGYAFNPMISREKIFRQSYALFKEYFDWVLPRIPEYIINGLPDEWYIRHERYEGVGQYPHYDRVVHEPFREVYRDYRVTPFVQFRAARWAYFVNFFPPLPSWGPGRHAIFRLFLDIFDLFWFTYIGPSGSFKLYARYSDFIVLFNDYGKFIVYFITLIYGIPYLVVTYLGIYVHYFTTPLRIIIRETVSRVIDEFFVIFDDTVTLFENYNDNPDAWWNYILMADFCSSIWMSFLIIPVVCVMIVIPVYLLVGLLMMFVVRPCMYLYYILIDMETDTLRTSAELKELCSDQWVVASNIFVFRFSKIFYSLKSFFTKVHYHLPPVTFLPRRWRMKGVKGSMRWWQYHSRTTTVLDRKQLAQFKADTLLIKEKGEEAYQKELDLRYWRHKAEFAASWQRYSFITNDWLSFRHLFFTFCWLGHGIVFIFVLLTCSTVLYKKVLFLQLFSDAIFPNGLPPLFLGTAAYPKSTPLGNPDLDDHRRELWATFTDLETLFYSYHDVGTHIDHYAEFILVIFKWFLVYFAFLIFVCGLTLFLYRGPRYLLLTYIYEIIFCCVVWTFGMGWSAYAFAGGSPEWDILGFRGPLNCIMFGEEWLFDNYLTGYYADDLLVMQLEKYLDTHWKFQRDFGDIFKYRNYHVRRYRKIYMRIYSPIEELLYPIGEFIETFRDVYWKELLEKWEPNLKKLRVFFWNEEEDEDEEETEGMGQDSVKNSEKPKTGGTQPNNKKK